MSGFSRQYHPLLKLTIFLLDPLISMFAKDVSHGAATSLHCCLCPYEELVDKEYYSDCKVKGRTPQSSSEESEVKLWNRSIEVIEKSVGVKMIFRNV